MHVHVTLDEALINRCMALHFNYHPFGKIKLRKLLWIPITLLIISAWLIYSEMQKGQYNGNFYFALLYVFFAVAYYFFMKKRMLSPGKAMIKNLGNDARFKMEIEDNKITTITNSATVSFGWSVFPGALISKEIVLLYQQNDTFSMFHQSFFKAGDFEKFKIWVKQYIMPLIEV